MEDERFFSMVNPKINSSQTYIVLALSLGFIILLIVGIIISKTVTSLSYTTRTTSKAAEYPTLTPTAAPKKSVCNRFGQQLITTTDGKCWSIGSKKVIETWEANPEFQETERTMELCYNELLTPRDEKNYDCPPKSYWPGPKDRYLCELYRVYGNQCERSGMETEIDPNHPVVVHEVGVDISNQDRLNLLHLSSPDLKKYSSALEAKCNYDTLTCEQGRYELINGKCWQLLSVKCIKNWGNGTTVSACCSEEVEMSYCSKK